MTTRQFAETGITSRSPDATEDSMVVVWTPIDTVLDEATSTPVVVEDMNMNRLTGAVIERTYQVQVTNLSPGTQYNGIEAITPEIATIDEDGFTTYVSDGDAIFVVKSSMGNRTIVLDHYTNGGETFDKFVSWVPGSLAQDSADAIDDAIEGKDPSPTKPLYTTQDHSGSGTYERNDACWANTWRQYLTCASPWNSNLGKYQAGTAITPRHIIFAQHWPIPDGTELRFITSDDQVITRTMVSSQQVTDPVLSDYMVGLLDSDLPASITPCQLMADEVATKLPNLIQGIPSFILDQDEKASVRDWAHSTWPSSVSSNVLIVPSDADRLAFYEPAVLYDSGNPCFFVVDGKLVLLLTLGSGGADGAGAGPASQYFLTGIQSAIDTLGNFGHTIDVVDLSSYPDYS